MHQTFIYTTIEFYNSELNYARTSQARTDIQTCFKRFHTNSRFLAAPTIPYTSEIIIFRLEPNDYTTHTCPTQTVSSNP